MLYKVHDTFIAMFKPLCWYFTIWSLLGFNLYWKKENKRGLFSKLLNSLLNSVSIWHNFLQAPGRLSKPLNCANIILLNFFSIGTFQKIEHVFVVGAAGGVPHYTNFYKHVRLGDIVISRCNDKTYFCFHVDKILQDKEGNIQYKMRTWSPRDLSLQRVAEKIKENCTRKPEKAPWERYIHEGQELLEKQEADFNRAPKESDRLYMSIGEENVIEV